MQVLSPITNQVLGSSQVTVTKSKETITGLKVREHKIISQPEVRKIFEFLVGASVIGHYNER